MTDDLVLNAILLRCECEISSLGLVKLGSESGAEGEPHIANCQLYITKGEESDDG